MDRFLVNAGVIAPENVIVKGAVRVSVLTERLIRVEANHSGDFLDAPTQTVFNRAFAKVDFKTTLGGGLLKIVTAKAAFVVNLLTARVRASVNGGAFKNTNGFFSNLGGTRRTLDFRLGRIPLKKGLMSMTGVSMLDDSRSFIIDDEGLIKPRKTREIDIYVFAYGNDYLGLLKDFYTLTGKTPLLPKYALSNWWSRYYPYTEKTYMDLMEKFRASQIPLSVATIDMDWHWVKNVPKDAGDCRSLQGAGWTGYSWNTDFFPDYKRFLSNLHAMGLHTTVNLHPADGVRYFEDMYPQMAQAMGVDPKTKRQIKFDMTDPKFIEAYFDVVHHPYEDDGVDFWWIDWQQGKKTAYKGLDPLWLLNHYHFLDASRGGERQPLILSRFAGYGSHRYPLGFSGDCIVAWSSLKFQPQFTATASNVGYSWWSHDIGGHVMGRGDDELYLRWLQLGVFSPINRLHSSSGAFTGKEPWLYRRDVCEYATEFLRLRHRMLPYLYTMNVRTHRDGVPLVQPMYYVHKQREAYTVPDEYYFGSELIVRPITRKLRRKFSLAGEKVWLPEGKWTDVFTGQTYDGGGYRYMSRPLSSIPVLAKEGAIIPLLTDGKSNNQNTENLTIKVYSGNNSFILEDETYSLEMKVSSGGGNMLFELSRPIGDCPIKTVNVEFCSITGGRIIIGKTETKGNVVTFAYDSAKEYRIEVDEMEMPKQKDWKTAVEDVLQEYHLFMPVRQILFFFYKRCGNRERALTLAKFLPLRRDVRRAVVEALKLSK